MTEPFMHAYIDSHPREVAKFLARTNSKEVLELLEPLDQQAATRLLASLDGEQLTEVLMGLPLDRLGELIRLATHDDAMTIIARLPNEKYAEIVSAQPNPDKLLNQRLYYHKDHTVGAVAGPMFIDLDSNAQISHAREKLVAADTDLDLPIYLLDEKGKLAGTVTYRAIFSEKNNNKLLLDLATSIRPLSERLPVSSALEDEQWQQFVYLPVVDGNRKIVGTVTRRQLQLFDRGDTVKIESVEEVVSDLATGYLSVCANLVNIIVGGNR